MQHFRRKVYALVTRDEYFEVENAIVSEEYATSLFDAYHTHSDAMRVEFEKLMECALDNECVVDAQVIKTIENEWNTKEEELNKNIFGVEV